MPDYDDFIGTVAERADAPPQEAERAACATLQTLAERLTTGETEDIAERLPAQLRSCLDGAGPFEAFHVDEFLRRVAERARLDRPRAERDARAVFVALWHTVGPHEFDDLRAELPHDFDPLLYDALHEPALPPAGILATLSTAEFA